MKTYKNLYEKICSFDNLVLAWKKARKGKTKKHYVIEFEKNLINNLKELQKELETGTYMPKPLKTFVLRDPKTRKISKSAFRDRIVHYAIVNILEPIFEKIFIFDFCANRKGKGSLFALKRFDLFKRKVSQNRKLISNEFDDNFVRGYCLKADIRHYFQEVNYKILIGIIKEKVKDDKLIRLVRKILVNGQNKIGAGMPLGNLTSQFLANVYLNKLDYFVKHELKARFYIRYVDDFVILHESRGQLEIWKSEIDKFLRDKLKLELHPEKSRIIPLSKGVDFVGFKNFYHYKILRKRNIKNILTKIRSYKQGHLSYEKMLEIFNGWNAYAKWADSFKLRMNIIRNFFT